MIRNSLMVLILALPAIRGKSCDGDGEHGEINVKQLQIEYSGLTIQGTFDALAKAGINAKTIQTATEETQKLNQYVQTIAAGYNSCAVTKAQYFQATQNILPRLRQDFASIDRIREEIEAGRKQSEKRLRALMQSYLGGLQFLAGLARIEAKLDQMDRKLDDLLQKDRAELKAQLANSTPTQELLQAGFWAYRSFNLRKESGASFQIGDCPGTRCYTFTLERISYTDDGTTSSSTISNLAGAHCAGISDTDSEFPSPGKGTPLAKFCFTGPHMKTSSSFGIGLFTGNKIGIQTPILDFNFIVESDRLSDMRLGLGIRDGSGNPESPVAINFGGLVDEPPTNVVEFYRSWGADPRSLPYRPDIDAQAEISRARIRAGQEQKVLMVVFGGNWCPDCLVLDRNMRQPEVLSYIEHHVEVVHVDVGYFESNLKIAAELGVDFGRGVPVAVFFSATGEVIGNTNQGQLEPSRKHNSQQVLEFLKRVVDRRLVTAP